MGDDGGSPEPLDTEGWHELRRWYELHRGQVEAEGGWVANRTNWLLNANAFMLTSMAIVSTAAPATRPPMGEAIWVCLPVLGVIVNAGTAKMIHEAEVVTQLRKAAYEAGPDGHELRIDLVPDLIGAARPHLWGARLPIVFAASFGIMWVVLGLVGMSMRGYWPFP